MANGYLWAAWIIAVGLWGLSIAALALNGIAQIIRGRPGFLPFERWIRKRGPATAGDCVLSGAAQVLQAFGLTLIAAPSSFMGLMSTTTLTTGWHPPSPPEVPGVVGFSVFVLYLGSLAFGMVCVVAAYAIGTKVNYVRIDAEARAIG